MRFSRFLIIAATLFLPFLFSTAARAQTQQSPSQEERAKAVNLVRAINTAEMNYYFRESKGVKGAKGRFASWPELYRSGLMKDQQLSPSPEIIPGYHLDLLVSPDGQSFTLALHDTKKGDGLFSVFSDQTGLIYLGAPLQ